jgi:hypothetical protein
LILGAGIATIKQYPIASHCTCVHPTGDDSIATAMDQINRDILLSVLIPLSTIYELCVICASFLLQVFVKNLRGKSDVINGLMPHSLVSEIKTQLESIHHIAADDQRLIYGGKQLEAGRTLQSYGISRGATVHLVMRLPGGQAGAC